MKYNIMVVLNSSYFKFGKIFIKSLYEKLNLDNIENVFISDIGLSEEHKNYFNSFDKVYVYDTELKTDFDDGGTWGRGWQTSVTSKTITFRHLLEETDIPLVMVDGDCIFTKDFTELIDSNYDIQACKRTSHIPYLASFVIAQNNENAKFFIDKWIEKIQTLSAERARESSALGFTKIDLENDISFGDVPRIKVSTHTEDEFCDDTYIIHLKSGSLSKDINDREEKGLKGNFMKLIEEYLSDE